MRVLAFLLLVFTFVAAPAAAQGADPLASVPRLTPADFRGLPEPIRTRLEREGCEIPQRASEKEPHNVVFGEFGAQFQRDWMVVCVLNSTVTLRFFWGGWGTCPDLTWGTAAEWMAAGGGEFPRVRTVIPSRIVELAVEAGIDVGGRMHQGVNRGPATGNLVVYCQAGQWSDLKVEGQGPAR